MSGLTTLALWGIDHNRPARLSSDLASPDLVMVPPAISLQLSLTFTVISQYKSESTRLRTDA